MRKWILAVAAAAALSPAAAFAHGGFHLSIGLGGIRISSGDRGYDRCDYGPRYVSAPVYCEPAPTYYAPAVVYQAPVVYAAPPVVYAAPPVYVAPPVVYAAPRAYGPGGGYPVVGYGYSAAPAGFYYGR